ncbi:hypothetical protein HZA56_06345 [Candidatus Poribacteria bacterium]|nr:hypothetical protein [Candidatus Poribacteria bacterium]
MKIAIEIHDLEAEQRREAKGGRAKRERVVAYGLWFKAYDSWFVVIRRKIKEAARRT